MDIDHDQIFKTLIEAFFEEFMRLFCPVAAELIDFSVVEFLRKEYFTDSVRGRRRAMDLVVKVRLLEGSEKFILIHVEFESKRPGIGFQRRMFRYFCQLFLRYDTEIIPIAVFTDDSHWKKPVGSTFELKVAETSYLQFKYHLVKLRALDYRHFLGLRNPLAYALMAKMDYNQREQVRMKADFLRLILGTRVDQARKSLLVEFVETYVSLMDDQQAEFEMLVGSDEKYSEVEKMVTVYEQRGIEKGIEKGKQDALIRLLQQKFGKVPIKMERAIRLIETESRLDQLLLAVLDAKSLKSFLD